MKNIIKFLSILIILSTLSSCYFLEYIIPEEYVFEEENPKKYPEFVWVIHSSGIQCGIIYFSTLESAVLSLRHFDIYVYDSYERNGYDNCECGKPRITTFYAKIKSENLEKAVWDGWRLLGRNNCRNYKANKVVLNAKN